MKIAESGRAVFYRDYLLSYRPRTQQHRDYNDIVIDPYRALSFYHVALHKTR